MRPYRVNCAASLLLSVSVRLAFARFLRLVGAPGAGTWLAQQAQRFG
jgi:hypothetical protein